MRRFAIIYIVVALLILGAMEAQAGGTGVGWKGGKPVDTSVLAATSGSATGLTNVESAAGTITTLTTTDATATSLTTTTLTAPRFVSIQAEAYSVTATAADWKFAFPIPADLAGYTLDETAGAEVITYTPGVTGSMTISIVKRSTAGAEATAYTLAVTTGVTSSSHGAGSLANRTVASGDIIRGNVTAIHSGQGSTGLWFYMKFIKP